MQSTALNITQEKMFEIKKAMRKVRPWYKRFPFALQDRKGPPQRRPVPRIPCLPG